MIDQQLPVNGTVYIRISDNVLDTVDWPIARLTLSDEKVVKAEVVHNGVYSFQNGPALGWSHYMINKWLKHDPTGSHPEIYHDLLPDVCSIGTCQNPISKIGHDTMTNKFQAVCACHEWLLGF